MSTWTADHETLLMAMADYITGDNVAGPLKRIIAAKKAVLATPPKAGAGAVVKRELITDAAVYAAVKAYDDATNGETCFNIAMRAALESVAPFIAAEREAEIERLRNRSNSQYLIIVQLKAEIDALRNPDIEAAAKRAEAAFHAGGSFRWDFRRERVERWRAVARAVLTGKSEGG